MSALGAHEHGSVNYHKVQWSFSFKHGILQRSWLLKLVVSFEDKFQNQILCYRLSCKFYASQNKAQGDLINY